MKRYQCNLFSILLIGLTIFAATVSANEVEEVFKQHEVVPDVIPNAPNEFLKITYYHGLHADKGNELTPTQVQSQPTVEWTAEPDTYYTLIMTDPDAPSRVDPKFREYKHWLVVNIPGDKVAEGDVLTAYIGSGPPQGTGLHRYVFLLYKQPAGDKLKFDEPHVSNTSRHNRPKFSADNFAKKYNLGTPIAGNFYQAQWDDYVPILYKQLSEN